MFTAPTSAIFLHLRTQRSLFFFPLTDIINVNMARMNFLVNLLNCQDKDTLAGVNISVIFTEASE